MFPDSENENETPMNVIVIYNEPQECGSPYLTFISQESGEVIETVNLPDPKGYYYSGEGKIKSLTPVKQFTKSWCSNRRPEVGGDMPGYWKPGFEYRVTDITDLHHESDFIPTWHATLQVTEYKVDFRYDYYLERDDYRNEMDRLGFDMRDWTLPERRKVDYEKEFLPKIVSTYKYYHIVNLIRV